MLHVTFRQLVCTSLPGTGETETEELEATTDVATILLLSNVPVKVGGSQHLSKVSFLSNRTKYSVT